MSHSFNVGNISRTNVLLSNYLEANGYMFIPSWWGGGCSFYVLLKKKLIEKRFIHSN